MIRKILHWFRHEWETTKTDLVSFYHDDSSIVSGTGRVELAVGTRELKHQQCKICGVRKYL